MHIFCLFRTAFDNSADVKHIKYQLANIVSIAESYLRNEFHLPARTACITENYPTSL